MIKLNKSENTRTLVVTYPRTIEILSGVYDNIADIENFKIQILIIFKICISKETQIHWSKDPKERKSKGA